MRSWLALVLLATTSAPCQGGEVEPGSHALCWRGRPLPECRSFLITEFGVLGRIDEDPFLSGESSLHLSFDLGWMKNISQRDAVGFTGYALAGENTSRVGVRGRYRRWFSRNTSLDIAPGVLLKGDSDITSFYDPPGFVVGASFQRGGLPAVTLEVEHMRFLEYVPGGGLPLVFRTRSALTWRAGAKLGAAPGVAAIALWAAVGTLIVVSNR